MRFVLTCVITCVMCLLGSACEEDLSCEEVCALENGCPGATQKNCPTWCADKEQQALTAECDEEWMEHMHCKSRHRELICDTALPCDAKVEEHYTCVLSFCLEEPSSPVCPSL